jgi:hypothetical protein
MKMKKSTKKILIIIGIVIFILGATALYYFLFIRKVQEERWYDSNWSYRRSVYIKDIPKELQRTKQDVLIEVDTKTLISEEKLVNDCRDIRFIDEDNSTSLKYWIEGGCNTDETQIWVNVQLPKSSEKIVYMYYGNKLAPDNQESWDGEFITMTTENCDNNWNPTNEFDGKFVLADSKFGITGGSTEHNHRLFEYSEVNCEDPVFVATQQDLTTCDNGHDNILSLYTTSVSNIPEYENVNFCTSRNGSLSNSSIILSDQDTYTGWKSVDALNNKFARGDDGTNPVNSETHIHYASCINDNFYSKNGESKYLTVNDRSRTIVKQTNIPYYTINYISNPNGGKLPVGSLMMVTATPPLGWEKYTDANNMFIKGTEKSFGSTTGLETHNHLPEIKISVKTSSKTLFSEIAVEKICLLNYLKEVEPTSEDSIFPPYITVPLARKNSSVAAVLSVNLGSEEKGEVLGTTGSGPSQPTELKTEGEVNPTNVIDVIPEFTAKFNHPDYP